VRWAGAPHGNEKIPNSDKRFFFSVKHPFTFWCHLNLLHMTIGRSPRVRRPERESEHSFPPGEEVALGLPPCYAINLSSPVSRSADRAS